jgi:hypothetical protein
MKHEYQDPIAFYRAPHPSRGATFQALVAATRRIAARIDALTACDQVAVRLAAAAAFVAALALVMWWATGAIMAR